MWAANSKVVSIVIASFLYCGTIYADNIPYQPSANATALLNDYYKLRFKSPDDAKMVLEVAGKRYPKDIFIQFELAYLYLSEKQTEKALKQFQWLHELAPENVFIEQQINALQNRQTTRFQTTNVLSGLKNTAKNPNSTEKSVVPTKKTHQLRKRKQHQFQLLADYFALEKRNPQQAKRKLKLLLLMYPDNIVAQKSLGFLYLREKKYRSAVRHFIIAYQLDPMDYTTAAQIGYLFDMLGKKKEAYHYFKLAFQTSDPGLKDRSYQALLALTPYYYKVMPDPYFIEFYTSPLYYSRFSLSVFPGWLHIGRTFGDKKQFELYTNFIVNTDNRSTGAEFNVLPSIYEDDYVLYGVGGRYKPFSTIPVVTYAEFGSAYDLIYQNRPRSREDFRGGVFGDYDWSAPLHYAPQVKMPLTQVGNFYGNISYYTRYNNDWIGSLQAREGFKFLQYHKLSIDAYARLFFIMDSNCYFYNNLYEYGPGFSVKPNNQWPLTIRLERRYGDYIDVNSPMVNPYGSHYAANIAMLELYMRI